ncbi:MAG: hypothetical protein CMJ26_00965 [Phycisphaerae bacterium]|nr:hypothetical protein [Phycisphaerae bacterium]|tara:strand:+ start:8125 stop:8667 length:543 start_codon:yes stop_codon:yes gene_type:complete
MKHENQQFYSKLTNEERQVESLLSEAMHIDAPSGLASRVAAASVDALLEGQLDQALKVHAPKNLTDNVFAASVSSLQQPREIIGRITHTVMWRQVALAACVVFAVLVAIRFGAVQQSTSPNKVVAQVLTVEEEGLLLEDLQLEEYDYLSGTRELAYAEVAESLNSLRNDVELWQYGLLTE